jgi:hypothetical protein
MTSYYFTISSEGWFPNFKVDLSKFESEIRAEQNILIALDSVLVVDGNCIVTFRASLSQDESISLESLVRAHDGNPIPKNVDASGNQIVRLYADTSFNIPAVSVLNTPDASAGLVKSWQMTVPALTTEYYDIIIADDLIGPQGRCFLAGGEYRCRTSANEGSALHLAIVDRDNTLGLFGTYGLSKTKLTGLTNIVGTINVGDFVHGDSSGKKTKVTFVGQDYCEVLFYGGSFTNGENLTFKNSAGVATGATATLGIWDEGDVIEIQRNVKDEWIEGFDQRTILPGGSKELPAGLYLRAIVHNSSLSDPLRVKIGFILATL